jgi:hypothetical protein
VRRRSQQRRHRVVDLVLGRLRAADHAADALVRGGARD